MRSVVTAKRIALLLIPWLGASACADDLGDCNKPAAQQLVYGQNGFVATKGQALLHDSCGSAAFCHSSKAKGANRYGAPAGLNFDTLPLPSHWPDVVEHRSAIWSTVLDGTMPPKGAGRRALGRNDWSFDPERPPNTDRLQPLSTNEGKAALRNWLACGAPVVTETDIPVWAQREPEEGALSDWGPIFTQIMVPKCATGGCHDGAAQGGLTLLDECAAYKQLLAKGECKGKPRLTKGDGDSYLLVKLESQSQECGTPMPPAGALPARELTAIRDWVEAGAPAANCK